MLIPESFEHFLRLFPHLSNGNNYLYFAGSLPTSGEGKKLSGTEKSGGDGVGLQIARDPHMTQEHWPNGFQGLKGVRCGSLLP